MKKYIEKNWKFLIAGLVVVFIIIPFFTQFLINIDSNFKGSNDGWLGFWGGYLGAIIGVAGAIYVVNIQLNEQKDSREAEKVDNTFFNLLSMHTTQKNILHDEKVFENIYNKFSEKLREQIFKEGIIFFHKNRKVVNNSLKSLKSAYIKYIEDNPEEVSIENRKKLNEIKSELKISEPYNTGWEVEFNDTVSRLLNEIIGIQELINIIESMNSLPHTEFESVSDRFSTHLTIAKSFTELIEWDISDDLRNFIESLSRFISEKVDLLSKERRSKGIEDAINDHYSEIGAYFRMFHRIVKYVNEEVVDEDTKNNYLGFLRATLNEKELLVVFYNAVYTGRGEGLLEEIRKTTFFGKSEELLEDYTVQHFNGNLLLWKSDDLKIMREFGNKRK